MVLFRGFDDEKYTITAAQRKKRGDFDRKLFIVIVDSWRFMDRVSEEIIMSGAGTLQKSINLESWGCSIILLVGDEWSGKGLLVRSTRRKRAVS